MGLIKAAFEMRRKTLQNAICAKYPEYTRETVASALIELGKDEMIRGERLSTEDFVNLSNLLSSIDRSAN